MKPALLVIVVMLSGCASKHIRCRIVRDNTPYATKWHHGIGDCQIGAEVMARQNDPDLTLQFMGPDDEVSRFKRWFKLHFDAPAMDFEKERQRQELEKQKRI